MTRILIIDDDPAVSLSLRAMLEYEEFDVATAGDGEAGIECFSAAPFDLIIVDIFMPGMDGLETIEGIRARDKAVPIIAITGFMCRGLSGSGGNVLSRALELGATVAMEKPFKRPDIVGAVMTCLEDAKRESGHARRWPETTFCELAVSPPTEPEEGSAQGHGALA